MAVVGAGVSGLTCGVVFAERGYHTTIYGRERGHLTTSAAAAAIWFPYDAEPAEQVIAWSLATLEVLRELAAESRTGVVMVELRVFSRTGTLEAPAWASAVGARQLGVVEVPRAHFSSGYAVDVPVADTSIYLDYLARRFTDASGKFAPAAPLERLADVPDDGALIINCSGIGARQLAGDRELEPHRGQIAVVAKLNLPYAIVCDDPPLMYAIPRTNDCVLGGTNDISDNPEPTPDETSRIVAEALHVLGIDQAPVLRDQVGIRPFRRTGVRLERERLPDGRTVIHNYGHGGSGFTLSWGCAEAVFALRSSSA